MNWQEEFGDATLEEENLHLKISICKFLCQFYDHYIELQDLKKIIPDNVLEKYHYTYGPDDGYSAKDRVKCVDHLFESAGERAYLVLGLTERDIYLDEEIWELERQYSNRLRELRNSRMGKNKKGSSDNEEND